MPSALPLLSARVPTEVIERFRRVHAKVNADLRVELSEAKFLTMCVQFYLDFYEQHGRVFVPPALYPEKADNTIGLAAEERESAVRLYEANRQPAAQPPALKKKKA